MHGLIAWCGFLGAWLLVAGPIYQAAVDLGDEQYHRDEFENSNRADPSSVSKWWWLLPPVWYWLQRQESRRRRKEVMASLSPDAKRTLVEYIGSATGWLYVGLGGLLIATKETWELNEAYEWEVWTFWALLTGMGVLSVANTAYRIERSRGVLGEDEPRTASS